MNRLVDQKGPEGEASVRLLVRMKTEPAKAQLVHHALQPTRESVASVASSHPPCKWDTVWDKVRDSCYHVHKSRSRTHKFLLVDQPLINLVDVEEVVARQNAYAIALDEHLQTDRTLHLFLHPCR